MIIIRKFITFLDIVVSRPLYAISFLSPRNKKLWVFIGWHRTLGGEVFADNTKYLFLHVSHNMRNINAVWLAKSERMAEELRSRGYQSYYERSLMGIWCALRAGVTVIDAFLQRENFRWSGRTKILQLLHGKGMKKSGYAKPQLKRQVYICGPSEYALSLLPHEFTAGSKTAVTGYSRDDVLFRDIPGSDISIDSKALHILDRIQNSVQGTRCILYAPTFRRGDKIFDFTRILPLEKLEAWAKNNNIAFFINLHPKYRAQIRNTDFANVFFFEESDIMPLLKRFDMLITDYSSIFTDFLLLDRPLVFYPYDFESYSAKEGIIQDYDSITPGPKARSFDDLKKKTEESLLKDVYAEERKHAHDLYHTYSDGKSSERIVAFVTNQEKIT